MAEVVPRAEQRSPSTEPALKIGSVKTLDYVRERFDRSWALPPRSLRRRAERTRLESRSRCRNRFTTSAPFDSRPAVFPATPRRSRCWRSCSRAAHGRCSSRALAVPLKFRLLQAAGWMRGSTIAGRAGVRVEGAVRLEGHVRTSLPAYPKPTPWIRWSRVSEDALPPRGPLSAVTPSLSSPRTVPSRARPILRSCSRRPVCSTN